MKYLIVLVVALMLLTSPAGAQEGSDTIEYGQTVSGEITNREFEIEYTFTGTAGDVIVIEMQPVQTLGDLDHPVILVLDTEYTPLWNAGAYGSATLAAVLPYDGQYIILATRSDGRAGDSVGEYTLTLSKLPVLEPAVPTEGGASSEEVIYYAIDATGGSFTVTYEKKSGEFFPEVELNAIDEGEFAHIATMSGEFMAGSLTIDPTQTNSDVLVLLLHEGLWDWNYSEIKSTYTLTIEQ